MLSNPRRWGLFSFFFKFLRSEAIESQSSSRFVKDVEWWWSGPTANTGSFFLKFLQSKVTKS